MTDIIRDMVQNRQTIIWSILSFFTAVFISVVFIRYSSIMNAEIISAQASSGSDYLEIMYSATTIKPNVTCALMYSVGLQTQACLLDETDFILTGYLASIGNGILTKTNEEEPSYVIRDARAPNQLVLFLVEDVGRQSTENDGQSFITLVGANQSPVPLYVTYHYNFPSDDDVLSEVTQAETISITSSNKLDPSIARVGDIISVTFRMNRPVISDQVSARISVPFNMDDEVTYAAALATSQTVVTDQGNNTFIAKYKVPDGALPGPVEFELYNLMDHQQNSSVPNIYTETTDGSVVMIVE